MTLDPGRPVDLPEDVKAAGEKLVRYAATNGAPVFTQTVFIAQGPPHLRGPGSIVVALGPEGAKTLAAVLTMIEQGTDQRTTTLVAAEAVAYALHKASLTENLKDEDNASHILGAAMDNWRKLAGIPVPNGGPR